MSRKLTGLILLGLVFIGCSKDLEPTPDKEVFSGELAVTDIRPLPMWTLYDTDRVIFMVEMGTYKLEHVSNQSNLCNSEGRAIGFTTNTLTLTPTYVHTNNCDSLKIPQGKFKSVFLGDSLYLGPDTQVFVGSHTDTMIYHFRLTK